MFDVISSRLKIIVPCLLLLFSHFSLFAQQGEALEQEQKVYATEVYFDFALFDIRTDADSTLQSALSYLEDLKEAYTIKITAHTDFVGTNERNQLLSQNRADAVKAYLQERGIAAERMEATVFGEEQPQANNDTDEGRQLNRRATIEVFKTIKMIPMTAQVLDEETGKPIAGTELIVRTKSSRDSVRTDENGIFRLSVPLNAVVGVDIFSECYFLYTKMLRANPKNLANLKFKLIKAKVGMAMDINNLYFVGNKDTLLQKSEPELPKILRFMKINDCLNIQIAGHINLPRSPKVKKHTEHFDLSRRRAKMVFDYLIAHGISEERIEYQGYGNWEMRYPNAQSEKEQALNRRVEIRVLPGDKDRECICDLI